MRVIIIHGTYGSPDENWFPYLSAELSDYEVLVPLLPTPKNQSLERWLAAFSASVGELRSDDIVIGHSMGAGFALRALEASEPRGGSISACLLVSSFMTLLDNKEFDLLNQSFVAETCDYQLIKNRVDYFRVYHGSDDPYVSEHLGRNVADNLDADFVSIRNGGHLNTEAGFTTFRELRDQVLGLLNTSKS